MRAGLCWLRSPIRLNAARAANLDMWETCGRPAGIEGRGAIPRRRNLAKSSLLPTELALVGCDQAVVEPRTWAADTDHTDPDGGPERRPVRRRPAERGRNRSGRTAMGITLLETRIYDRGNATETHCTAVFVRGGNLNDSVNPLRPGPAPPGCVILMPASPPIAWPRSRPPWCRPRRPCSSSNSC